MRGLLSRHQVQYLLCEQNTVLLDHLGIPRDTIRRALQEHGYRCFYVHFWVDRARMERVRCVDAASQDDPDAYGDYLFVAPDLPVPLEF
jgi:hypothetical protein